MKPPRGCPTLSADASQTIESAMMLNMDCPPGLTALAHHDAAPRSWIAAWPEVQRSLLGRSRILLALDFDSVVAPAALRPGDSGLPEDLRHLLLKLQASPRITLALLSGRSLQDLRGRAGFDEAIYVGNHGMEVAGPGLSCTDGLASSCRSDLVDVLSVLTRCARRLPGVVIEDRELSLAIHWQLAGEQAKQTVGELLSAVLHSHPRLELFETSGAWNVRGRASWDKSHAISQMLDHLRLAPADMVYLADTRTDQHIVAKLAPAFTFSLSPTSSVPAGFHLSTHMEMMQLLFCVLCVVNEAPLG